MTNSQLPGLWIVSETVGSDHCKRIYPADGITDEIARVYGDTKEETETRAHLIAKAPEMLDCLRELIKADDSNDANIMHVVAIKAELLLRDMELS